MREVPAVEVDHAVATVDFHDGSDERDDALANFANIGAVVDREAIRELHERGGRAGFRRVNRAGDVIDGRGLRHEAVGLGVVELDGARIGELRETRAVFVEVLEIFFGGDGDSDHFAAFFGGADGEDPRARGGLLEKAHVFVHIFGVGEDAGRAGDVAEDDFGSGNVFRGGQIIDEGRSEDRCGGVLLNFCGVGLVNRLRGIACGRGLVGAYRSAGIQNYEEHAYAKCERRDLAAGHCFSRLDANADCIKN